MSKNIFNDIFDNCYGIFVLSNDLKNYLELYFSHHGFDNIPICSLIHPKEITYTKKFDMEQFKNNKKKNGDEYMKKYIENAMLS